MQERVLRIREVISLVGLSRSQIYQLIREKRFPPAVALSERARGWSSSAINEWIVQKINASVNADTEGAR